jgi:F0F1-type ATP synthase membrane subunit b/b'
MEDFKLLSDLLVESKAIVLLLLVAVIAMLWKQLQMVTAQRDSYIAKFIDNGQAHTEALVKFTGVLETLTKEIERRQ